MKLSILEVRIRVAQNQPVSGKCLSSVSPAPLWCIFLLVSKYLLTFCSCLFILLTAPFAVQKLLFLVSQSCPTLCNPMDYNTIVSYVHADSPGKNTGVGYHALLQGVLPKSIIEPRSPTLQVASLLTEPSGNQLKTHFFFFCYLCF